MASSATLKRSEVFSLELYQTVSQKYASGENRSTDVQNIKYTREKDRFEGMAGLPRYDLATFLLVLMRFCTRFLAKVKIGRRVRVENVDIEAYVES